MHSFLIYFPISRYSYPNFFAPEKCWLRYYISVLIFHKHPIFSRQGLSCSPPTHTGIHTALICFGYVDIHHVLNMQFPFQSSRRLLLVYLTNSEPPYHRMVTPLEAWKVFHWHRTCSSSLQKDTSSSTVVAVVTTQQLSPLLYNASLST